MYDMAITPLLRNLIIRLFLVFFILQLAFTILIAAGIDEDSSIGVCYGPMLGDNLPPPHEVVKMYKQYGIKKMRLYEPNRLVLEAIEGSSIQVILGVRDTDLISHFAQNSTKAKQWVRGNIKRYWPRIHFRYIVVGNEMIPGPYAEFILPAMKNLKDALRSVNLWQHVKVSTAVGTSVLNSSNPPSLASFANHATTYMKPIALFLKDISAPLFTNIHPYFTYIRDSKHIQLAYALFNSEEVVVQDADFGYQNLFHELLDAFYVSLEKAKAHQVSIVVSETGWPSRGKSPFANREIAKRYNTNLVRNVLSSYGTPRKSGTRIETYIFTMFNENNRSNTAEQTDWGLFYPNKERVYPIKFR